MRMEQTKRLALVAVAAISAVVWTSAQTAIKAPDNKYSVAADVDEGEKAAKQIEKELPILRDDAVTSYVQDVGARLATSIPPEFEHKEFKYTFKVVDVKDINAFALPGGPMFVHRGIIEAAHTEGELAGVMAHEMSHVALRHGTAQATKATKLGIGSLLGAVAASVVGGTAGDVISSATNFGLNTTFLRFSRDYEKQADILGVQIMARSGYDPRDLGHMFETIEKEGGSRPPQWMSDHPNPGNRVAYINEEASHLTIANVPANGRAFADVQDHLKTLPPAPSMEELAKQKQKNQKR